MSLKSNDPYHIPHITSPDNHNIYYRKMFDPIYHDKIYFGERLKNIQAEYQRESYEKKYLEIGSHMGHTLKNILEFDEKNLYLGMDITFKRIITSAEKTKEHANCKIIYADATHLDQYFLNDNLNGVIIFFPDPWPKKKHAKKRLLQKEFCQKLYSCLKNHDGFLWLKTDSESYFAQAHQNLIETNFIPDSIQPSDPIWMQKNVSSLFEKVFIKKGLPIYQFIYRKKEFS